ncbi:hypothetical protein [Microbacterium yannicii]|nr:hypothetical protein [Microbacterium yannicii]
MLFELRAPIEGVKLAAQRRRTDDVVLARDRRVSVGLQVEAPAE